jgi:sporulation protein YlmC with PRC-barrel domain
MRPSLKLVGEVRDLQIVDKQNQNCGICDDVEFEGGPGAALTVRALLVGPGAIQPRLPRWLAKIIRRFWGVGLTRIPWKDVESITSRIVLKATADHYHLHDIDRRLSRYLAKIPALP